MDDCEYVVFLDTGVLFKVFGYFLIEVLFCFVASDLEEGNLNQREILRPVRRNLKVLLFKLVEPLNSFGIRDFQRLNQRSVHAVHNRFFICRGFAFAYFYFY